MTKGRVIVVQHGRFVASGIELNSSVRAVGFARRWPVFAKSGRVVDLAEWLVRNGLALDRPTYSKSKYDGAQCDTLSTPGEGYGKEDT